MNAGYSLAKTRNIGFIAHVDAGKTTTTERILYYTGKVYRLGEVDEGTATMDWMEQEKERGITITSATTTCFWEGYRINIIDTPGHVDFMAEVERSLRVLDGAVGVFCAVGGVEAQSETVWLQAKKYNVPRIAYINKMDRAGANFFGTVEMMRSRLSANPFVLQIPIGSEENFVGVIDLVREVAVIYKEDESGINFEVSAIPSDLESKEKEYRRKLIEQLAEKDDAIMQRYLNNQQIPEDLIKKSIRENTLRGEILPVFCGSSLRNKGIQLLLDGICDFLPSPLDRPSMEGANLSTGLREERKISDKERFSGLVFKIVKQPYVGTLAYLRVYSGALKAGSYVYNANKKRLERISRLLQMHANKSEELKEVRAGEIAAVIGLKFTTTGDTLCSEDFPILLERVHFPIPVLSVAVEPKTKADQEKISFSLSKLTEEDPTFKVRTDSETGQTIISGMGELHLEVLINRLIREFKVEAKVGKPEVAYRETSTTVATGEGKFIKQTGGRGQYGHVQLEIEPIISLEPASRGRENLEFVERLRGENIPHQFIPAIRKGVVEAMESGELGGFPILNLKVTLLGGSSHPVDSNELAFKVAALMAFKDAYRRSNPIILEPIMRIEIITPEEFMGEVIGDLNSRRGRIEKSQVRERSRIIGGFVPLASLFGYATALRSLTQGRATYSMEPSRYEEIPKSLREKLIIK
ncbi:MAG: elongation factor G [Candidatus Omnitrophica bacterium]|nr:elongation factor G [Candidatus Omnitrophota bacterium]